MSCARFASGSGPSLISALGWEGGGSSYTSGTSESSSTGIHFGFGSLPSSSTVTIMKTVRCFVM